MSETFDSHPVRRQLTPPALDRCARLAKILASCVTLLAASYFLGLYLLTSTPR